MKLNNIELNTYIHAIQRSEMKRVKQSGVGHMAQGVLQQANKVALNKTTGNPTDFSTTLIDAAKKKVNII